MDTDTVIFLSSSISQTHSPPLFPPYTQRRLIQMIFNELRRTLGVSATSRYVRDGKGRYLTVIVVQMDIIANGY